jgi:hypothetical protein
MAILSTTNQFQSWILSPEEFLQGGLLTTLQKQVIQNQIASVATQKINLEFTPSDPLKFAQQEAGLRGQIEALSYLLTLSEAAEFQLSGQRPLEL